MEDLQSAFAAPAFLVEKPGDQWRMVIDYRKRSDNVEPDDFLCLKRTVLFTFRDCSLLFIYELQPDIFCHQQPIIPQDRGYTAFVTHKWLYQYTRLQMGMQDFSNYFQLSMNGLFAGLLYQGIIRGQHGSIWVNVSEAIKNTGNICFNYWSLQVENFEMPLFLQEHRCTEAQYFGRGCETCREKF